MSNINFHSRTDVLANKPERNHNEIFVWDKTYDMFHRNEQVQGDEIHFLLNGKLAILFDHEYGELAVVRELSDPYYVTEQGELRESLNLIFGKTLVDRMVERLNDGDDLDEVSQFTASAIIKFLYAVCDTDQESVEFVDDGVRYRMNCTMFRRRLNQFQPGDTDPFRYDFYIEESVVWNGEELTINGENVNLEDLRPLQNLLNATLK